jgi:hypothetical protein
MDQDKGFTVNDRRSADQEGRQEPIEKYSHASAQASSGPDEPKRSAAAGTLAAIDFATFVLSLATSAQINLGSVPNPETNQTSPNLPAAKQIIDIIGLLQEKTKGNLDKDEATLLEQVLFSLRMHYVRIVEEQKKSGGS